MTVLFFKHKFCSLRTLNNVHVEWNRNKKSNKNSLMNLKAGEKETIYSFQRSFSKAFLIYSLSFLYLSFASFNFFNFPFSHFLLRFYMRAKKFCFDSQSLFNNVFRPPFLCSHSYSFVWVVCFVLQFVMFYTFYCFSSTMKISKKSSSCL